MADVVLITGLSGAGRSAAAAVLEDLDWYVIDNLPTSLVERFVGLATLPGSGIERLALVSGRQHTDVLATMAQLRSDGHRVRLLFLDADTPSLVKRYDASRRKHPMSGDVAGLVEAIEHEREMLSGARDVADMLIDTSSMNVHQLKAKLVNAFDDDATSAHMQVSIESFGFKHGLPIDADIVMDVRFLPNPHWDEDLRPLTGHDPAVRDYVIERAQTWRFLDQLEEMLADLVPAYEAEGKSYLTVAIGCTGGRHRSVAV
ncbi:MAG TPA: RNase adapter RapZ, partial [Ilumatobacteraceae bacterium]|nr:RNase adapter RapZ [Ilumatobacteraceae bacterium]